MRFTTRTQIPDDLASRPDDLQQACQLAKSAWPGRVIADGGTPTGTPETFVHQDADGFWFIIAAGMAERSN